MMRAFLFQNGKATEVPFADGAAHVGSGGLVWLHLDGVDSRATDWVAAEPTIPHVIKSALTAAETRPRSDVVGAGALLNLRGMPNVPQGDGDDLVSVRLWAEQGRCISLAYRDPASVEQVIACFLAAKIQDPGDLITAFAEANTDLLDPEVSKLGDALDALELRVDHVSLFQTRRKVAVVRAQAISFRRFVAPQRAALERLALAPVSWLDETDRSHLREAADRAARISEELESVRERSALMHEEITDRRAEQMDSRALLIAIVALVFLPLTFITGLLGMNVEGIPLAREPWAFWGVVAFCVVVGIGMTIYFVRAHWISK
jgi:zinc transporter